MATITFNKSIKHILLSVVDVDVSVQELVNAIRDYEALLNNFDLKTMMTATGKDNIGAGVTTSITLTLLDGWKLNAQARASPTVVTIFGGNFITDDGSSPFFPVTNVTYDRAQSTSGSLLQAQAIEDLKFVVESSTRENHTGFGKIIYWDPVYGNDLNDGFSEQFAVQTFAQAQTIATDGGHDMIYALPDASNDITIVTENIIINKNWLFLRSVGKHFELRPNSGSAVVVNNYGAQIEGMVINGINNSGTNDLVVINDGFCQVKDVEIKNSTQHGIYVNTTNQTLIDKCDISGCVGDGIKISDGKFSKITDTLTINNTGSGINLTASFPNATIGTEISNVISNNNTIKNITIGTNVIDTLISENCVIADNGGGRLTDNGTSTFDSEVYQAVTNIRAKGGRSLDR